MIDIRFQQSQSLLRSRDSTLSLSYDHRESAMRPLILKQKNALDKIRSKYHSDTITALRNLSDYFLGQTDLAPDYVGDLNKEQKESYYKDIWHTAYRCLISTFNPWISRRAEQARKDSSGIPLATDFSEKQLETIAAIGEALNDKYCPLASGYTKSSAKELFAQTLSDIGRAHNRDNNNGEDDMEGDKPSCQMGIDQRLVQFIMIVLREDPSERPLTVDLMKQRFQGHFISEKQHEAMPVFDKIEGFDEDKLTEIEKALESLIMLESTSKEKELLNELFTWKADDLERFMNECKGYYGNDRFTEKLEKKICFQGENFDNFGDLILALARDPLSPYCEEIKRKIENKLKSLREEARRPSIVNQRSEREILIAVRRCLIEDILPGVLGGIGMAAVLLRFFATSRFSFPTAILSMFIAGGAGGFVSGVGSVIKKTLGWGLQGMKPGLKSVSNAFTPTPQVPEIENSDSTHNVLKFTTATKRKLGSTDKDEQTPEKRAKGYCSSKR